MNQDNPALFGKTRFLERQIDEFLDKADEVMMVSYTGTTEVVLPMTRDRRALRSALKDQIRAEAINLMADNETTRILETIQAARDTYAQTRSGVRVVMQTGDDVVVNRTARLALIRIIGTAVFSDHDINFTIFTFCCHGAETASYTV